MATKIDWKRSAPIWSGNVMSGDGKLVTGRQFVKAAAQKVIKVIGLHQPSSVK